MFFKVYKKVLRNVFNEQQKLIYKLLINLTAENLNPSVDDTTNRQKCFLPKR